MMIMIKMIDLRVKVKIRPEMVWGSSKDSKDSKDSKGKSSNSNSNSSAQLRLLTEGRVKEDSAISSLAP